MGLFVRDDPGYDPDVRQTGFNRYKQLLSLHAVHWIKLNLLTVAGALPLAAGVAAAILSSSILVLFVISLIIRRLDIERAVPSMSDEVCWLL